MDAVEVTEKWKVLESKLIGMDCLNRYHYKYLGMNYSRHPETKRVRFEYIFRNPCTVWMGFYFYPKAKRKRDLLDLDIHSPFIREALSFPAWVSRCCHGVNPTRFDQFSGDFNSQASELIKVVDQVLLKRGLEDVLRGNSGIDIPSLSLRM